MPGVVKLDAVPKGVPMVGSSYQLYVAGDPLAERSTIPGPHREPSVPIGADGTVWIVAVTVVRGPSQFSALTALT